ncbi:MAG: hypothetical protein JSU87_01930 [Gemmatimonadota bacterium]|nr:MAG: hypothetical protein JSU87_01930 [Gemmatimonadota bacterium]
MPNRFSEIARESRERTNAELEEELARLTPLTQEKLSKLFPRKSDKEELAQLMAIVTAATEHNEKVAALRKNIDQLGGAVLKVLGAVL